MRGAKLLIAGGTGYLGHRLLPRLARLGCRITVPSRNASRHRELALIDGVRLVNADVHDPAVLARCVAGQDAVINLVGILNEDANQRFDHVHVDLVRKLVAACRDAGVARLLQMSALHAGQGESRYLASRGLAEEAVRGSGLDWSIVQAPVLFGADGGLVARFGGLLRMAPVLPLPRPHARMAPLHVDDAAAALVCCLGDASSQGRTLQLAGPETMTLIGIVRAIARAMGLRRWIIPMPDALGALQARLAGLAPGKPFSRDNFLSLKTDSVAGTDDLRRLGIKPRDFTGSLPQLVAGRSRAHHYDRLREDLRSFVEHRPGS